MKRVLLLSVAAIACFFFALATGATLYYRALYALVLAVIGSWLWARLSLFGLHAQVERASKHARVGDTIEERITVFNRSPLPKAWLEVQDQTNLSEKAVSTVISISSRGMRTWKMSLQAEHRGVFSLGPVRITSSDPLGLFVLSRRYSQPQELVVYPATVPVPHLRLLATDTLGEGSVRLRARQVTPHAASVRDYHPGDLLSRIHWPTSARTGSLMVKDFEEGMGGGLWLLPDFQQAVQRGQGAQSTDEYAATIAASIAQRYLNANMPVGLLTYAEKKYILPPERGEAQLRQVYDHLARAKAIGTVSLAQMLNEESGKFDRYATLVVITPSLDLSWARMLQELGNRRVRIVVVAIDASSFGGGGSQTRVLEVLNAGGVMTYRVSMGDNLTQALSLSQSQAAQSGQYEQKASLV